jgi:BASS family bile acid:Na+ symporter
VVDQKKPRTSEHFARAVHRHFLWLLLGCYALATLWPRPGLLLRQWQWSPNSLPALLLSFPLLLLALILFTAALRTDLAQIRTVLQQPAVLCAALLAVWLGPALLVVAAGFVIPWAVDGQATTGLLVGLVLVAAMPVANSSVGWTQNAEGNLALGLALVVLSISLSPFVTPQLFRVLGTSLSAQEQAYCEALVNRFSGVFFIIWVILPTAAGFLCRYITSPEQLSRVAGGFALASAAALLMLNYINSALALPEIYNSPTFLLVITATLAASLSLVGLVFGWAIARLMRLSYATRSALLFGLSMKHTGLALILAGAVLANEPLSILMIVLATLMQHLLAAVVQWYLHKASDGIAGKST